MKSATVSTHIHYSDGAKKFDEALNGALTELENNHCAIHTIKYSTTTITKEQTYILYSAVILYDEVPTRKVLTEKKD